MIPIVNITPRADADMTEIRDVIATESPRAAQRFFLAVQEATTLLASMPELAGKCEFASPSTRDLRIWSVPKFKKYLIFYRPIENGIEVVRVLHAARYLEPPFE